MRSNGSLKRSVHLVSVKAYQALKKAVAKVIQEHEQTGDPVVIWRDGKVAWVPASQLLRQKLRRR